MSVQAGTVSSGKGKEGAITSTWAQIEMGHYCQIAETTVLLTETSRSEGEQHNCQCHEAPSRSARHPVAQSF
jgi:hypothetical protein